MGKYPPNKNPNDEGTITYPFSRDRPNIEALQAMAQYGGINEYVDLGAPGASLNWDALYGSSPDDRVVFVHANGSDLRLDFSANREARDTLVVYCGNLTIGGEEFPGLVLVLDEPSCSELCGGRSRYRSEGANVRATSTSTVLRRTPQYTWTERRG